MCDNVVAEAPESGLAETDLICSNCGAELRGPGPLEKAAETIKAVLKEAERRIEDTFRPR
jgi:hypothetical protein